VNEFISRSKTANESMADAVSKLILPSCREPFLHAMVQNGSGSTLVNQLLAWFHQEGADILRPCPRTGLTIADLTLRFQSPSDTWSRARLEILVQRDPTLLDKHPEIIKYIPTHDIVFEYAERLKQMQESSQAESGSSPLKSFLSELPYDILREIVHHCSIRGMMFARNRSDKIV
jgi:hypothetical protein